jgi:hypothetical protein
MLAMLSIVIGIVFVMLLFSLLATTTMELLSAVFSMRGSHLIGCLKEMLGPHVSQFTQHPYYQQLAGGSKQDGKKNSSPSYIAPGTFSAILSDVLLQSDGTDIEKKIDALPDDKQKELVRFLYRQSNGQLGHFKIRLEEWYNEVMDRASGAYKRKTKNYLLILGLIIALVFNVDPLEIYYNLSMNASLSEYIADMATDFSQSEASTAALQAAPNYYAAKEKIGVLVNENISSISQPLGLGWSAVDPGKMNLKWWMYKIIGWLTTALAISMGATFWFDMLKQLVSLRSSGPPATTTAKESGLSSGAAPVEVISPANDTIRGAIIPPAFSVTDDDETPG